VDHIVEVDLLGNIDTSQEVLAPNGVLAVYGPAMPPVPVQFSASNVTVRFVLVYEMPEPAKEAAVEEITRLLKDRKLTFLLGPRFTLESTAEAHLAVESGAVGNVTVDVGLEG